MICFHCSKLINILNSTEIFGKHFCEKCGSEIEEEFDLDDINEKAEHFRHQLDNYKGYWIKDERMYWNQLKEKENQSKKQFNNNNKQLKNNYVNDNDEYNDEYNDEEYEEYDEYDEYDEANCNYEDDYDQNYDDDEERRQEEQNRAYREQQEEYDRQQEEYYRRLAEEQEEERRQRELDADPYEYMRRIQEGDIY